LLLIRQLFCKAYWTTPCPFKMHSDFRPLFRRTCAELSGKYPYLQTPAISRGRIRGKANTRGLGVWLSQSLTFGSLAAALGAFLRLQKATLGSTSGRCKELKTMVLCSPSEAWLLARYHSPAGPRAAVGGSPLHIMIHNIKLSRNFRE